MSCPGSQALSVRHRQCTRDSVQALDDGNHISLKQPVGTTGSGDFSMGFDKTLTSFILLCGDPRMIYTSPDALFPPPHFHRPPPRLWHDTRRDPEMGSLPPQILGVPGSAGKIDAGKLGHLFRAQRSNLEHFFDHLDLARAADFAQTLLDAPGAVFFSGVGKSGIVAHKLAQTLASLGFARSAFLPPVDALHGDLGAVFPGDLLVLLSKSGASQELLALVPCARAKGARLLSLTSAAEGAGNPLATLCDVNVHLPLQRELCPFGLAPVTSAAIQMMFGDTVIAALMAARRLTKEKYAANHPAGKIGKSLIFKVR
ncbi:hypothetical protein B296_00013415 [Ensete ventricosum]|uniref:SIS domain-containing protein n=1 Tax=Ensete ventricosum TaxID=4639 RepID=A0A427AL98_ENSVE|nr:hypothetical protein B296_00013415 [Ensete ventricosum]